MFITLFNQARERKPNVSMNFLKLLYDPVINLVDKSGISERQIRNDTGIARRTIDNLRLSTIKNMITEDSIPNQIYDAQMRTMAMLSIYFDFTLDSAVYVADFRDPKRITTLAEARKNYQKVIRYKYTTDRY